MGKFQITCAILVIALLEGCCNTAHAPIGVPDGPKQEPISQELWDSASPHLQDIIEYNSLQWETFYDEALGRIRLHDARLPET